MDRQVWTRLTEIFDAALERPVEEREDYVRDACGGDEALAGQVRYLLRQFDVAGAFLEQPLVVPDRGLAPGDVLAGRYRIDAMLGRGGMGEVYRAHDDLIDEPVALKTLRREIGDDPGAVRRLRREVQLARKVTHPNVCRVFEVGLHERGDGSLLHFFTMQLLEGETLAARLSRAGPIAPGDAYPVVAQVANGLEAAHQAGIVHRDFKSANVILCEDRALITDFGLAGWDAGPGGSTHTVSLRTQIFGTVGYMSPEQLSGGELTAATDIYSFGIVLFEMLTGRRPFSDAHIIQAAMERAAVPAPDLRALAPEIDARWARAITRCLQRDPARRYRSALEAAAAVQPRWRPALPYWSRRRWLATAVVAAGVALIPVGLRFSNRSPQLPDGATALLMPVTNSTGEPDLDGITELFRNQLAQSVHFSLLDPTQLSEALKQMQQPDDSSDPKALREAAWRLNAILNVFAGVSRVGPDYALSVSVETRGSAPDIPRTKSLRFFSASDPGALMRSVREASNWIREIVGESAASIASFDRLPENATTPSWQALAYYARGQRFYVNNDWEPATREFEAALHEDEKFTLAAMRRADLLMSQSRQTAGMSQWRAAIAMLADRPVTRAEELFGRGMFAFDSGDMDAADRYFQTWSAAYPHDWRARYYRTIPLALNGHVAQALELLTAIEPSLPGYADLYAMRIACYLVQGNTDEARAALPALRRLTRPERADLREAYIRYRDADCLGCLELLRTVQRSTYRRGAADAMLQEGLLLIDAGYAEAAAARIDAFLRAGSWVETAPEQTALRVAQAWAEMLAGRRAAALGHARQALGSESGPLIIALTGTVFARLGARDLAAGALRMTDDFQDLHLYRMARHRINGELLRMEGRVEDGVVQLRQAAALEPALAHRQYLIEALPPGSPERLELSLNAVRVPWQGLRPPVMHHIGAMRVAVADVNAAPGMSEPFAMRFAEASRKLSAYL